MAGKYLDQDGLEYVLDRVRSMIAAIYPVGAIYMSVEPTDPGELFGGTWERIRGRFLLAESGTYAAGSTGGSANAIVPYHRHSVAKVDDAITGGSHTHTTTNSHTPLVNATGSSITFASGSYGRAAESLKSSTHTHDLPAHNTAYAGTSGNTTGANMPPYLAVYVWKRTE